MKGALASFLVAALLAALPIAALAQQDSRIENGTVNLDFDDVPLTTVIELIAKLTRKNFLYDDTIGRGTVTLISPEPVSVEQAYRVFEAILAQKGFTTVDGPAGITKIIPIRAAKESPIRTVTGDRRPPNRDNYITRLLPLRYIKADALAQSFRPLISKDANLIAYAPTNTIILTDSQANIRRMMGIIDEIDIETYRDKVKVIPMEFADAGELASHLTAIFSESGTAGRGRGRTARRVTRARTQRSGGAAAATADNITGGGSVGEPRFITDERTNSIIVIAPQATIEQVEKLVILLDYKREGSGRIHVYRLQNADSEELAQTLAALTGGGSGARPGAARGGGAAAAAVAAASAVAQLDGNIRITADAPTNSLIIQASAEGFAALRDVIEKLDIRRPQVMVEALIMEVGIDDTEDLGIGWLLRGNLGGTDGRAGSAGFGTTDALGNSTTGALTGVLLGRTIPVSVTNAMGMTSIQQLPVIQAAITASAIDSDTNIISAPVILTADNEEAQIIVGSNIPILTSRLQSPDGSGTNVVTSQNIERQDVGVTLRVTPQISEGDTIRLQIFQEISEVVSNDSSLGPTTTNRQIENTVYVSDGESVMIGGIIGETQTADVNKVPFLGDIPVIGWAFKTTGESVRKTNLLLILTPHIVRDTKDLQKLTVEQREKFRGAARGAFTYTDEEREARRKALEAGIDLPTDINPVRRRLESHARTYPTESLPEMRREAAEREAARQAEMEALGREAGGSYVVQVSLFSDSSVAVSVLERLMSQGYDGTILSRVEADETLHFVQLGPYLTAEDAHRVAREVRSEMNLSTLVIVEP